MLMGYTPGVEETPTREQSYVEKSSYTLSRPGVSIFITVSCVTENGKETAVTHHKKTVARHICGSSI